MKTETLRPTDWRDTPVECSNYVTVHDGSYWTGFPVVSVADDRISVNRFPLPKRTDQFEMPSLFYDDKTKPVEQKKLKVAAVSCVIEGGSPAKNLEQIAKWSKLAAEKGADLVLFNETSATGYWQSLKLRKLAEPLDGPTVKQLIKIANENNIVICAGMIEKAGDKAHNTQVIVGPKGLIGYHRKSRLPGGEEQWFDIGSDQNVFEVKGIKIGVAICFESIQPDTCRTLTAKGSQVILAPYCNGVSAADIHNGKRPYLSNRAKENHVWYIACDQFGLDNSKPDKPVSSGAVCFVNPKGEIVATTALEEKKEHLIVYDLNLSLPDTK